MPLYDRAHKNESKLSPRRALAHQKAIQALQLRAKGATYEQIATQVGYSDRAGAKRALERLVKAEIAENAESIQAERSVMCERLDLLTQQAMSVATGGLKVINAETREVAIADPKIRLSAADTVVRLIARRCALLGLDTPTKHEVTGRDGAPLTLDLSTMTDEQLLAIAGGRGIQGSGGAGTPAA